MNASISLNAKDDSDIGCGRVASMTGLVVYRK